MILALVLLFQVIQGGAKLETYGQPAPPPAINVGITPTNVTLGSGQSQQFTATVTGGNSAAVTWAAVSGIVTNTGLFTAPAVSTDTVTYVTVTSTQDPTQSATAIVTITAPVSPPSGLTLSGACPSGQVGSAYTCTLTASGGTAPYSFLELTRRAAHRLIHLEHHTPRWEPRMPPGLTMVNGVISGIPSTAGTTQMTIQVSDSSSPVQTVSGVVVVSISPVTTRTAMLPQVWANPHESDLSNAVGLVTKYIHTNGSGDYACTLAGLQKSMDDWAAAPNNVWWHVVIDDALSTGTGGKCSISGSNLGFVLKAKTTGTATGWIVYTSAHPNATGQTVCNRMQGISLIGLSRRNDSCTTTSGIDDYQHLWEIYGNQSFANGSLVNSSAAPNASGYGPSHIVIQDAELDARSGSNTGGSTPIYLWSQGSTQAERVNHVGFQRDYFHSNYGDAGWRNVPGSTTALPGLAPISNFITLDCWDCWVTWSYMDKIQRNGSEGHVFGISNGGPGLKVAQNFIEGAEVGWMSGGNTPRLKLPPSDFEIRNNVWTMNPHWMEIMAQPAGQNYNIVQRCIVARKNTFEFKEVLRSLIDGNVFENSIGCAQHGQGPTFTVRAFYPNNDTADISDLTFTNNVVRHAQNGIDTSFRSGVIGSGNYMSRPARRWYIVNNLLYDITASPQGPVAGQPVSTWSSPGNRVLQWNTELSTTFTCNALRDAAGATVTLSNCLPDKDNATAFGPGNNRTNQAVGDPTVALNCSSPTFNTNPLATSLFLPPPALDTNGLDFDPNNPAVFAPQYVTYANAGPPNETGTCTFRNQAGFLADSQVRHNTYVFTARITTWSNSQGFNPPYCAFQQSITIQDEIYLPAAGNAGTPFYANNVCGGATGVAALRRTYDPNTLTFNHMLMTGAVMSGTGAYNEMFNNGVSTPSTSGTFSIWAPTLSQVNCAGATASATCIGVVGGMNGNAVGINTATDPLIYYSLDPSSVYKAGGSRQASDGTDMGADMNAIRNAMHRTIYPCPTTGACGSTGGPYPD